MGVRDHGAVLLTCPTTEREFGLPLDGDPTRTCPHCGQECWLVGEPLARELLTRLETAMDQMLRLADVGESNAKAIVSIQRVSEGIMDAVAGAIEAIRDEVRAEREDQERRITALEDRIVELGGRGLSPALQAIERDVVRPFRGHQDPKPTPPAA